MSSLKSLLEGCWIVLSCTGVHGICAQTTVEVYFSPGGGECCSETHTQLADDISSSYVQNMIKEHTFVLQSTEWLE